MFNVDDKHVSGSNPESGRPARAAAGLGIAALIVSLGTIAWSAYYATHVPDDLRCFAPAIASTDGGAAAPVIAALSR